MKAVRLVTQAAHWNLLGLLLQRPTSAWRAEVAALAAEIDDAELLAAARTAADVTEGDYLALVGPGGAASPREVSYCGWADPGHVLANLSACYQAFAFAPRAEDPIDHVAVETAFVSYLLLKEAFARNAGDDSSAAIVARARRRFVADHLAVIAGPLLERLAGAGENTPFVAALRILAARVPPPHTAPAPELSFPDGCGNCGAV